MTESKSKSKSKKTQVDQSSSSSIAIHTPDIVSTDPNNVAVAVAPQSPLCPICQSSFKSPMVATCGHSVCEECLQQWIQFQTKTTRSVSCPTCRDTPLWFFPCYALNSFTSPHAIYRNHLYITEATVRNKRVTVHMTYSRHHSSNRATVQLPSSWVWKLVAQSLFLILCILFWQWPVLNYTFIPLTTFLVYRYCNRSAATLDEILIVALFCNLFMLTVSYFISNVVPWIWLILFAPGSIAIAHIDWKHVRNELWGRQRRHS